MNDIYLEIENPQDCDVSVDVGITDYNNLEGKPKINGVTLEDNKTAEELGLQDRLTPGQNITIEQEGDNLVISSLGGGGKTFRLLNTVTGSRVAAISRNLDDSGQSFHYKDLIIEFSHPNKDRSPVFYLNDDYGTEDGFANIPQSGGEKIYFYTNSVNNLFYAPISVSYNNSSTKVMTPKFAPPNADNMLAVTQHTGWSCTYVANSQSVTIRVWGDGE